MSIKEKTIVADSVKFWLEKRHMKQGQLAEAVGVEPSTISQIANGHRLPSLDLAIKMADALSVSLPEFFACKDETLPDIVFIDRVKARPRAGNGGLETDGHFSEKYSFHSSFITRKRGTPDSMKLFEIAGDSMNPTLSDGDLILVNLKDTDVRSGYIYLVRMEEELMVKRLENRPGGILLIRSDNPDYDPIEIDKNGEGTDIQVYGRMVWSCREY